MVTTTTGDLYHEKFRPPPPPEARGDDEVTVDVLPGDRVPGAVAARLESYRSGCDGVVRSFALTEAAGEGGGGGGASADAEQKQGEGAFQWDSGGIGEGPDDVVGKGGRRSFSLVNRETCENVRCMWYGVYLEKKS